MANNPMQQFSVHKIGPEIKIAGIAPPYKPPLKMPTKKGMPRRGGKLNESGINIAMAIVAVNPGKEPTSIPKMMPPQIIKMGPQFKIRNKPSIIS